MLFLERAYGIETKPNIEWKFVVDPVGGLQDLGLKKWPAESGEWAALVHMGRIPRPISEFDAKIKEVNDYLGELGEPLLKQEEFIAARLYGGPMFGKYSAVLRSYGDSEVFRDRFEKICKGNRYVTTLHAFNSAIIKLSKTTPVSSVYRCIRDVVLPRSFWEPNDMGVRGCVEFSFFCATTDRDFALSWGGAGRPTVCVLFEGAMGIVDRGADLGWISQYPEQCEITFPALTAIENAGARVEGGVLIMQVHIRTNMSSPIIDSYIARKKNVVSELVRVFKNDIRAALGKDCAAGEALFQEKLDTFPIGDNDDPMWYNTVANYSSALNFLSAAKKEVLDKFTVVHFDATMPDGTKVELPDLARDFTAKEKEELGAIGESLSKYADVKFISGEPEVAALGITQLLGVPEKIVWGGKAAGLAAMEFEIKSYGTEADWECFDYIVNQVVGSNRTRWPHSGNRLMDHFDDRDKEDQRTGKRLEYFVNHERSKRAGLLQEHVVALRGYTTAMYKTMNDGLRSTDRGKPHPFPVTMDYLCEGIKRLRAVGYDEGDSSKDGTVDFWRGTRNVEILDEFARKGGTEFAPMSTSSDFRVALMTYSNKAQVRLLFKIVTQSFMDRGADLTYLSAFPGETEFLYPPMTYLQPTGRQERFETPEGVAFTIVEVSPKL